MNRRSVFFLTSLLLTFALTTTSHAFFKNDLVKAKDFMQADMYQQAVESLNKHIMDKPTDAEAHYLMGLCYVQLDSFSQADECFNSAIRLEPDYKAKIGRVYKQTGLDALIQGQDRKAQALFEKAVKFQPDLKSGIGRQLYDRGHFHQAIEIDPSLRSQVVSRFYNKSQTAEGEAKVSLLKHAIKYGGDYKKELGEYLVALAKAEGTSDADKKRFKIEAGKFLTKSEMGEAFPPDY